MNKILTVLTLLTVAAIPIACKQGISNKETREAEKQVSVKGEEIRYTIDSTTMRGYIVYPNDGKKHPGILVIHEWWGHNAYVRERATMLANLGYTALAIDMYGDGKQAQHPEDAGKFAKSVMRNMEVATARFNKALEVLKNHPSAEPSEIAAIGYCFGGSVALTMANMGADLDAVAVFHSGVQLPVMPTGKLKAKVLVCNGADDPFITKESELTFKAKMDSVKADYQYIAYKGAVHSFTSKAADSLGKKFNMPVAYNQEADEKSWAALQQLLQGVFH